MLIKAKTWVENLQRCETTKIVKIPIVVMEDKKIMDNKVGIDMRTERLQNTALLAWATHPLCFNLRKEPMIVPDTTQVRRKAMTVLFITSHWVALFQIYFPLLQLSLTMKGHAQMFLFCETQHFKLIIAPINSRLTNSLIWLLKRFGAWERSFKSH